MSSNTGVAASKSNAAYETLKSRILDDTYGPGYRIVIADIGREVGLSNGPVREALRRLQAEGWVELQPNIGARVTRFSEGDHRYAMQLLARLDALALVEALPFITSDDLARARELNRSMEGALDDFDPQAFSRMNTQFHAIFSARCPDAHLRAVLEAELQRFSVIRRSVLRTIPGRARQSIAEHDRLIALIESGAHPDEIEKFATQHKLNGIHPDDSGEFAPI